MKPTIRIFSFGESKIAQTMIASAMTGVCSTLKTFHYTDEEFTNRKSGGPLTLLYESEVQEYSHLVCRGIGELSSILEYPFGANILGLWAVEAARGVGSKERAIVKLLHMLGVREVFVFLQSDDPEDEALDSTEVDIREALQDAGFSGDEARLVRGDARDAPSGPSARFAATEFLSAFEARDLFTQCDEAPLLARIDSVSRSNRGLIVNGQVLRGRLVKDSPVVIFGDGKLLEVKASELSNLFGRVEDALVQDDFEFTLPLAYQLRVKKGHLIGLSEKLTVATTFEAEIFSYPLAKGKIAPTQTPRKNLYIVLSYGEAKVELPVGELTPGEVTGVRLKTEFPFVCEPGFSFELFTKGEPLALGVIRKVLATSRL